MHASLTHTRAATGAARWLVTPSQWGEWRGRYDRLPLIAAFEGEALPEQWTACWHPRTVSVLLETGKQGRYTILGNGLRTRLSGNAGGAVVWQRQENGAGDRAVERLAGPPLRLLPDWLARRRAPPVADAPPFYGGLVGYLAYDAGETLEALRLPDRPALAYPWYVWAEVEEGWVFDHEADVLFCFSLCPADNVGSGRGALETAFARAQAKIQGLHDQWHRWRTQPVPPPPPEHPGALPPDYFTDPAMQLSQSSGDFIAAVRAAQERIAAGETYQVNLSIRQSRPLPAPPERIYEALRRLNPSPYMALLRFPEVTVVSGSPELLLSVAEGRLEAHPIAATRPRGPTPEADAALAAELASNAKECAEHLMLVDLLRNDIGRVAAFGTVRVMDFMAVERYSHVMHLVSRIEGTLAAGRTVCDAITALFPGGTITGAPKVRTMEIIGELEPLRRGIYTGAIGWLGYHGNAKLNIAIRTLVAVDGEAQVQSGAGIVADSEPAHEFEESLNKARALWLAAERAAAEGGARG
ncbi:MAG: anthranilate synthase component I family protein [Opitutaceae bacterium]